jgi:hypothetical protein
MGYVRDDVTPRRCLVPSGARVHCGGPRVGKLVLDQGSKFPVNQPSILMPSALLAASGVNTNTNIRLLPLIWIRARIWPCRVKFLSKGFLPMMEHAHFNEPDGMAALGICKALLIALTELGVE